MSNEARMICRNPASELPYIPPSVAGLKSSQHLPRRITLLDVQQGRAEADCRETLKKDIRETRIQHPMRDETNGKMRMLALKLMY